MTRGRRAIVVLAKWPRPGQAKRRLARDIGSTRATALARAFLSDTLALSARSAADRLVIAYAPALARARFAGVAPDALLVAQPRGSFGTRLEHALGFGLARARSALVIGTDSPTLPERLIERGFAALADADCVIGPAEDGGYYLIGASRALPSELFHRMPWSTADVFDETLRRARDAGLRVAVLPLWYDLDDDAGLRRIAQDRAGLRRAPATHAALTRLGSP
jgi:rSAM/selenodomain-associated transferase 1